MDPDGPGDREVTQTPADDTPAVLYDAGDARCVVLSGHTGKRRVWKDQTGVAARGWTMDTPRPRMMARFFPGECLRFAERVTYKTPLWDKVFCLPIKSIAWRDQKVKLIIFNEIMN
jgi:hypothetical protein